MKNINLNIIATIFTILVLSCSNQSGPEGNANTTGNNPHTPLTEADIDKEIHYILDSVDLKAYFPDKDVRPDLHQDMKEIYENKEYSLIWNSPKGLTPQGEELLQVLERAEHEGLNRENYNYMEISAIIDSLYNNRVDIDDLREMVHLDLKMTASALTFASHLTTGRIDPSTVNITWRANPREVDYSEYLTEAINNGSVAEGLMNLRPNLDQYEKLKSALADYRKIIAEGGWPLIPEIHELKYGDQSPVVEGLRKRLHITGDLSSFSPGNQNNEVFDSEVEYAIRNFQRRHMLEQSGTLNSATRKELNVSPEERARQIKINMERMRWLPENLGEKYVLVNIPEYKLRVYNQGNVDMEMKVIVGQIDLATPIFSDEIQYVVFRPDWNVPHSIAIRNLLPEIKKDPGFVRRNNYEILTGWGPNASVVDPNSVNWDNINSNNFNYRIRQAPGSNNALGLVQFMFPNDLSIYLHDTPHNQLFNREQRAFSAGCIRVERPAELAEYLLKDRDGWDRQRIRNAMHGNSTVNVHLPEKVPVHLLYYTVWVEDDGTINFRKDLYQLDEQQMKELREKEQSI